MHRIDACDLCGVVRLGLGEVQYVEALICTQQCSLLVERLRTVCLESLVSAQTQQDVTVRLLVLLLGVCAAAIHDGFQRARPALQECEEH